jgi:hypothetical protein
MTNEEITAEFENLFATEDESEDKDETPDTSEEETQDENQSTEEPEESSDDKEGDEDSSEDKDDAEETSAKDSHQAKQNHAFAEQRLRIKKQDEFIKNIGKLIGFDEKASLEDIEDKVKDVLLEKEAKAQNVPVDILKRLEIAEAALQETNQIKLEKRVTESFTDLIDEHNLSQEEVDEFTKYLIDNNKNPMLDENVDLKAEYLKLHYKDMVAKAVADALGKEAERKKKVDEQASSGVPNGSGDKEDVKINTVKDLDDFFNNVDL